MAISFDYTTHHIVLSEPQTTTLTCQELINAIRDQEDSEEGIAYGKIADAGGKVDLGDGATTGIAISLVSPWQVEHAAGAYQATIKDGNLSGGLGGNPVAYVAGVQVKLIQSVAVTIVPVGSGLSDDQNTKLEEVHSAHYKRRKWDKVAQTVTLYGDDGVTPVAVFDTNEDLSEITPA